MRRIGVLLALLLTSAPALATDTLLVLRGRDGVGLRALLARQQDPASADYRRWLTPQEFGRRFGATRRDLRWASRWLRAQGCRVRRTAGRHLVRCSGVRLPRLPRELALLVLDVLDAAGPALTTYGTADQIAPLRASTSGAFVFTPDEFAAVYNLTPIRAAGIDGTGQRIGILGFTTIDPADVNAYRARYGLPTLALTQVGAVRAPGRPEEIEALLDVSWSGLVAPGAAITLVAIPFRTTGAVFAGALARLVNDGAIDIISLSVGFRRGRGTGPLTRVCYRLFRQAAAQGQTVLVASGDSGGRAYRNRKLVRGTEVLPSSPHVTAVGGTTPAPVLDDARRAVGYGTEVVWHDGNAGSGGGASPVQRPSYQQGRRRRTVPDVAFPAAPMFPFFQGGRPQCCVGGTSAAAPTWAGVVALLNQQRGRRAGFLNPTLYDLGRAQAAGGAPVFHDVTTGTNNTHPAGPGYDLATGWGSIDGQALFAAFANP